MTDPSAVSVDEYSTNAVRRRGPVARAVSGDIIQFADFLLVIAASIGVAYGYHRFIVELDFDFQYYAAAGIIGATGLTALLRRDGYYEFDKLLSPSGALRAVASRWVLVVLGLIAFGFSLKVSENFSRVWLFSWMAVTTLAIVCMRALAALILRRMIRAGGAFSRRIAVVGATSLGVKFAAQAGSPNEGVSIEGVYDTRLAPKGDENFTNVKGDIDDLVIAARNGDIDDIVIAIPRAPEEQMQLLIRRLSNLPVSISICPNIHWLNHTGGAVAPLGGVKVLSLYRRPLEGWGGVLKTIEDYVLASSLIIALSPIMLAVAIAIKLQGKGPILFAQQRHGFNNTVFRIYKFRTMTVAEDGDTVTQAQKNDSRITPLGGFLRRYSLDELPQLFNVIRGEMSLVGPRPHALAHNHQYAGLIRNYSGRHKVKPGITGWAQVNGFRGETSETELMEERVTYDLSYVDKWSLWFDFKILALTVKAVVFPKNAV